MYYLNINVLQKTKKRTKQIEFAVGMIGRHKIYDYTCVVYGWDPLCQASHEWIILNGVLVLPHKDQQPFYNVLAHDGTERYVAQGSLKILISFPHFPEVLLKMGFIY